MRARWQSIGTTVTLLAVLVFACAPQGEPPGPVAGTDEPVEDLPLTEPGDPSLLRIPFTAEQIRDTWRPGLVVEIEMQAAEIPPHQRWTVMSADEAGADIEFASLDGPGGEVVGEPQVSRSSWQELRDHAAYPAEGGSIEDVTRETALGMLDGWLYRSVNPESGAVSEVFFARSLPGLPVEMRTTLDGEVIEDMRQVARKLP